METQLIITTNLKYVDLPEVSNIMKFIARLQQGIIKVDDLSKSEAKKINEIIEKRG